MADTEKRRGSRVVGLAYEAEHGLPHVVFKASGEHADAVLGRRGGTPPVVRDPELARALFRLPVEAPIGRELFTAVAAVLVHLFAVDALGSGATEVEPHA